MTKAIEITSSIEPIYLSSGMTTRGDGIPYDSTSFTLWQSDSMLNVVAGSSIKRSLLFRNMCVTHFYQECARKSGSVSVDIQDHFGMPVIVGNGGNVPLRDFVNCLDENLDIDEMRESLPQLSYAQIDGAIKFLVRLSEFNIHGVDITFEEDKLIESAPEIQAYVRNAMAYDSSDVRTAS